jgi:hypothetical protein
MNAVRFGQTLSKEALFRFGVTAAACVAAMIVGPFIVTYDNPLTTTLVIAAIPVFLVAIINPFDADRRNPISRAPRCEAVLQVLPHRLYPRCFMEYGNRSSASATRDRLFQAGHIIKKL